MKRREFIALVGGLALSWPLVTRVQTAERVRRIGVLLPLKVDDPTDRELMPNFIQALKELGWIEGDNLKIEYRGAGADPENSRKYATELVALAPDVIISVGGLNLPALLHATRTIPIVFLRVPDPVAGGYVDSLARPGGNATGFASIDYSISAKWLELLKEIAPDVTRVAVIREPTQAAGTGEFGAIQTMATSIGMPLTAINIRSAPETEEVLTNFARIPNGGLIVTPAAQIRAQRDLIITLSARLRLPAIYYTRDFVKAGGLMSYSVDQAALYRSAASYVDRILRGQKVADLPVQAPTKYELLINLKTAKSTGLAVPPSLLARADEVVE